MTYWLLKSEPETFSIGDLACSKNQTAPWEGVRNYQVRNMIRDEMKIGDLGFFYHSSCTPPGIVGIVEITKAAYPDHFALDKKSKYFDPKATKDNPRWFMVDVALVEKFPRMITLEELRANPTLQSMIILKKGNRLSITKVSSVEWKTILKIALP